jgi:hypothetical protein
MFYLKGRHLRTAGIFNLEETVPETIDTEGRTKAATQNVLFPRKWR